MTDICGRHFQSHFLEWKILNKVSLEYVPYGLVDNMAKSDNGLAPNRRLAIIWTNDDMVQWHIYASRGFVEFSIKLNNFLFLHFPKIWPKHTMTVVGNCYRRNKNEYKFTQKINTSVYVVLLNMYPFFSFPMLFLQPTLSLFSEVIRDMIWKDINCSLGFTSTFAWANM